MTLHLRAPKWQYELLKEKMQETTRELDQQILKGTGARTIRKYGIFQSETFVHGFFETNNGKRGSFSFLKSLVPALVVNIYSE